MLHTQWPLLTKVLSIKLIMKCLKLYARSQNNTANQILVQLVPKTHDIGLKILIINIAASSDEGVMLCRRAM